MVPPWNMYMLKLAPLSRKDAIVFATDEAGRVWCLPRKRSNQPHQNSMHISGPSGLKLFRAEKLPAGFEPKFAVTSAPGVVPPASI